MRELLIGDCHFGIKSNNTTWLSQQLNFFDKQVIPILSSENIERIIFLGDVFDIRYSVNQQVGIEVKNLFRKLCNKFSGNIYIIAGNHDYYSPLEEYSKYNAYQLVFGDEFLQCHKNLIIVDSEPLFVDGALMLPWYYTENTEHFDELLYNYDFKREVKAVYCHADLTCWPGARIASLQGVPIYAGHIHYIVEDPIGNLHNLGAVFPLTFNDVNQDRFLYILEDFKIEKKIKNTTTFQFKRIFNEEIFTADAELFDNSYVQLCISAKNINKARYVEQIKYIKSTYIDATIRLKVLDDEFDTDNLNIEGFNTDVSKYIDDNIPDYLTDKYKLIKDKLSAE